MSERAEPEAGRPVAVEEGLEPVRRALAAAGYTVVGLHGQAWRGARAVVVSGIDDGFLGREDTALRAPVIDAAGLRPGEVVALVRARAGRR